MGKPAIEPGQDYYRSTIDDKDYISIIFKSIVQSVTGEVAGKRKKLKGEMVRGKGKAAR